MSAPRRDTAATSGSAHGITAVRRISRISNGIAVNAIEVEMGPEPAWADYSVPGHASLSVHLAHTGGEAELRLKRDQPAPDGPLSICFTPAGAPIWGTHREQCLRLGTEPLSRRTGWLATSHVRRATDYVMDHLSEPVRLSALADLTDLSQWHFARVFKAATGLSPHQWQLNARIAKAQQLLLSRAMPHAQIALEVGFAEQSHLCRVFKNVIGVSPAAWLRDYRVPRESDPR